MWRPARSAYTACGASLAMTGGHCDLRKSWKPSEFALRSASDSELTVFSVGLSVMGSREQPTISRKIRRIDPAAISCRIGIGWSAYDEHKQAIIRR